jgi:predicted nucleic acid-binding protein
MVKEINTVTASFSEEDTFIIDANVLILLHSSMTSTEDISKASCYSNFIQELLKSKCTLCVSALNLQEVFHVIERLRYKMHLKDSGLKIKDLKLKEFRNISCEREKLSIIQRSKWSQITTTYTVLEDTVTESDLSDFLSGYTTHVYDPIDFLVAKHNSPMNYITDDKDFTKNMDITVYTYSAQ